MVDTTILFNHAFLLLGFWQRNKITSRFYSMPSQRFSSLRNAGNGILEGKIGNILLGGGAWLRTPSRNCARGTGPSLVFHTIGDEGYVNSVQPPPPHLSEIPGSAPAYTNENSEIGNQKVTSECGVPFKQTTPSIMLLCNFF